jgi:hypothetical protein
LAIFRRMNCRIQDRDFDFRKRSCDLDHPNELKNLTRQTTEFVIGGGDSDGRFRVMRLPQIGLLTNAISKNVLAIRFRITHTLMIMDAPLLSPTSINRQAQMNNELQEWSKVFSGEVSGLVKPGFNKVDPATTTGIAQSSFMASLEGNAKKIEEGKSSLAKMVATKNKKLEEFLARQRIAERIVKRYEDEENERRRQEWESPEEEEEEDSE